MLKDAIRTALMVNNYNIRRVCLDGGFKKGREGRTYFYFFRLRTL